jgi:hypothetical protein
MKKDVINLVLQDDVILNELLYLNLIAAPYFTIHEISKAFIKVCGMFLVVFLSF